MSTFIYLTEISNLRREIGYPPNRELEGLTLSEDFLKNALSITRVQYLCLELLYVLNITNNQDITTISADRIWNGYQSLHQEFINRLEIVALELEMKDNFIEDLRLVQEWYINPDNSRVISYREVYDKYTKLINEKRDLDVQMAESFELHLENYPEIPRSYKKEKLKTLQQAMDEESAIKVQKEINERMKRQQEEYIRQMKEQEDARQKALETARKIQEEAKRQHDELIRKQEEILRNAKEEKEKMDKELYENKKKIQEILETAERLRKNEEEAKKRAEKAEKQVEKTKKSADKKEREAKKQEQKAEEQAQKAIDKEKEALEALRQKEETEYKARILKEKAEREAAEAKSEEDRKAREKAEREAAEAKREAAEAKRESERKTKEAEEAERKRVELEREAERKRQQAEEEDKKRKLAEEEAYKRDLEAKQAEEASRRAEQAAMEAEDLESSIQRRADSSSKFFSKMKRSFTSLYDESTSTINTTYKRARKILNIFRPPQGYQPKSFEMPVTIEDEDLDRFYREQKEREERREAEIERAELERIKRQRQEREREEERKKKEEEQRREREAREEMKRQKEETERREREEKRREKEEKERKQQEAERYKKQLANQIERELDNLIYISKQGLSSFINYIYTHYPPKDGSSMPTQLSNSALRKLMFKYHPDKLRDLSEKDRMIYEEIGKIIGGFMGKSGQKYEQRVKSKKRY